MLLLERCRASGGRSAKANYKVLNGPWWLKTCGPGDTVRDTDVTEKKMTKMKQDCR